MAPAGNTAASEAVLADVIGPAELAPRTAAAVAALPPFLSKIRQCERLFGARFAELDLALQDELILRRLQQMVNTLLLNPVWADRIRQAGLHAAPRNFDEWQAMPLADKSVMRDLYMGGRPGLVVPLTYGGFEIVASGGTGGGLPVETVYSLRELRDTYDLAGEFMGQYQLRDCLAGDDPKWLLTTLADYQMWSSGTMVGGVLQQVRGVNYIGAGPVMKDVFHHMMSYQGPKAILGISAGIAFLTELGVGLHEDARRSLRAALYGSGVLHQRKQLELKAMYPNVRILSYFAATQAETIGLQLRPESPHLATVPGLHLVEIVDDAGRWVGEGEEGELVVTRLHAHEAPLPRLKIGDRVVRRPDLSGPGLRTRQFEFAGRSAEVIHVGDTQYAAPQVYASLCRALKATGVFDLEAVSHDVQFHNDRDRKRLLLLAEVDDPMTLNARVLHYLGAAGTMRTFITALMQSLSVFNQGEATYGYVEKSGYVFEIRFVARGSRDIHRTAVGKVPLLRDRF